MKGFWTFVGFMVAVIVAVLCYKRIPSFKSWVDKTSKPIQPITKPIEKFVNDKVVVPAANAVRKAAEASKEAMKHEEQK